MALLIPNMMMASIVHNWRILEMFQAPFWNLLGFKSRQSQRPKSNNDNDERMTSKDPK